MEFMFGVIILVVILITVSFTRSMVEKVFREKDEKLAAEIIERRPELLRRTTKAYNNIIKEFGEDALTPEEIYNKLHKIDNSTKTYN